MWGWLLRHHSASNVVPFTLLVPIFGIASSALVLQEQIPAWKILAGILVVLGLCVNLYGSRNQSRK
jgi:O-acetylserine/cysteine efflux transporter